MKNSFRSAGLFAILTVTLATLLFSVPVALATDLGAQINSAIAALPATGGVVNVCAMTSVPTTYVTQIALSKPVTLQVCTLLTANTGSLDGVLITSSGVRITGIGNPGTAGFAQFSAGGANLVLIQGALSGIFIDHLLFQGVNTTSCFSGTVDNGITDDIADSGTTVSGVQITNNIFSHLCGNGVYLERANNVTVSDNIMTKLNSAGARFAGLQNGLIAHNFIGPTNLQSTSFNVALDVDSISTSCTGCTNSLDVRIIGNTITSYPNAQGILIHDGTRITVADNDVENVLDGIGIGTYGSSDSINNVTISGNIFSGTNTSGALPGTTQTGITVAGLSTSNLVKKVTITGNNILNFNALAQGSLYGGIGTIYADTVSIVGNSIYNNYYQAVVIGQYSTRLNIRSNNIFDTVNVSGSQYGIRIPTGQAASTISGSIAVNTVDDVEVCNEFDSLEKGVLFSNGTNDCTNSGTYINGSANVTLK